jgi:ribose 5-phosphate isomerase B
VKIVFGSDHAGLALRRELEAWAASEGHAVESVGAQSEDSFDYPDAADELSQRVLGGSAERGILVCGSGIGMCIRANRFTGIRAANVNDAEMARLARQHNHANVLCLAGRYLDFRNAQEILKVFLETEADSDPRHIRRVEMLDRNVS